MTIDLTELGLVRDPLLGLWHPIDDSVPFDYSDGDEAEERIAEIVEGATDRSVDSPELAAGISDWPSRYHLTPQRANLLAPFLDQMRGPVLEIGAGMGAVTRSLGEAGVEVVALEGSARRARIAAQRCADLPDVQVVASPLQALPVEPRFGAVLLIGVLEYSRIFFDEGGSGDPIDSMLRRARDLLMPGGVLYVAIENQLGLKYFAGYNEDHRGEPMFGIEDRYCADTVVTFGRKELGSRLRNVGLIEQDWWYPFPDYKLPVTVISDRAMESPLDVGGLAGASVFFDAQQPSDPTFALTKAWKAVGRNGLVGELANSFLVRASSESLPASGDLAWHFGNVRAKHLKKTVVFTEDGGGIRVLRIPLVPDAEAPQLEGISLATDEDPFRVGHVWTDELAVILSRPGWSLDDVLPWAERWWAKLIETSGADRASITPTSAIDGALLDASPRNLIVDGGDTHFIDLEWRSEDDIEVGWMMYRAMFDALESVESVASPVEGTPMRYSEIITAISVGLGAPLGDPQLEHYWEKEDAFQRIVKGGNTGASMELTLSRELVVRERLDDKFAAARLSAQIPALTSQIGSLQVEGESLREEIDRQQAQIEDLEGLMQTLSWRITRPLRSVRGSEVGRKAAVVISRSSALIRSRRDRSS